MVQLKNIFQKSLCIKSKQYNSDKMLIKKTKGGIYDGKHACGWSQNFLALSKSYWLRLNTSLWIHLIIQISEYIGLSLLKYANMRKWSSQPVFRSLKVKKSRHCNTATKILFKSTIICLTCRHISYQFKVIYIEFNTPKSCVCMGSSFSNFYVLFILSCSLWITVLLAMFNRKCP